MKNYLKLVNFEFNRFLKLYLVLIGVVFVSQLSGVMLESVKYLNLADKLMYEELLSQKDFLEQYGQMSFMNITGTFLFFGPIMLSIATLVIYVFFIWYRDWFGKNTFIYRLLMLPTERLNVYLAKATTILLCVLGLVGLQLLFIQVEIQVMQWIVPDEFRMDLSVRQITFSNELILFYPSTFSEFILHYGSGMVAVFIVFTAILFERSYRLKGILFGVLYGLASVLVFMLPILVDSFLLENYFYPLELLALEVAMGLLVLAGALWLGHYLLKNKIRV